MQRLPIAVIGASGYSGMEATRILAHHPSAELRLATSDRWQGDALERRTGLSGQIGKLRYAPQERAVDLAGECAAALLCTPVEVSLALAPALLAKGLKVVDLSGAFRIADPARFQEAYGIAHPRTDLLAEAVYGMPELPSVRERVARARLVANPGCYPTAAILPLAPLYRAGVLAAEAPIVDAASGVTGAGRKASEDFSFVEVMDDFRAYRVLRHQHTPEIGQALSGAAGAPVDVTFTPHLLPLRRGILATSYLRLGDGASAKDAAAAWMHDYASEPFLRIAASPDEVALKSVVGTNLCQMGLAAKGSRLVVISAIDNLVKGAAGQAIQNLNLLLGWPETAGLDGLRGSHP
ncbi:MAG: N-acetyl-gamma-glutamyl-phosphate reductase [Myxococcales bacterium]